MRHVASILSLIPIATFVVIGCSSGREAEAPLTPAAGTSPAIGRAVESLANASCDHELRCNRIGPNAEFSNRDHCMNVMRNDASKELRKCGLGVDQEDLNECLNQIADEDCGGVMAPLDRLGTLTACGWDDLCR